MNILENLTPLFLENPKNFLKRFLIRIPISQTNFRTTIFDDYILVRNSSIKAYDLALEKKGPIEVAELQIAETPTVDLAGGAIGRNLQMRVHYSPYIERKITSITLDRTASFFFSAELSGCSLAFSNDRPIKILHIPPTEFSKFNNNQPERYRLFDVQKDYKDDLNKRTVIVGFRNRYGRRWHFFKQTYVDARLSTPAFQSFGDNGFKFLRLSGFEEF